MRHSILILLATTLLIALFACEKETSTAPLPFNEDGMETPTFRNVDVSLRYEEGLIAFDDTEQFQQAIMAIQDYNGPDIEVWTKQLPIRTLHALKLQVENQGTTGIPSGIKNFYFDAGPYGETTLVNVNQTMSKFLSEDGIVRIGNRLSFITRYYQVSTSVDRYDEFREAIRSGASLDAYDVNLDHRDLASELNSRVDHIVGVPCGLFNVLRTYSQKHRSDVNDNRYHAMEFSFDSYNEPMSREELEDICPSGVDCDVSNFYDGQSIAWQAVSLRSISYKRRHNRYNTRHHFSWLLQWRNPDTGENYVQEYMDDAWGRDEEKILMLTLIPGTSTRFSSRQIEYALTSVNRGWSPGLNSSGTWGTHRGMGDGNKVRWTCQ